MNFDFSPEQQKFAAEVEQFLDAHDDARSHGRHAGEHGANRRHPGAPRLHDQARRARLARHDVAQGVRRHRAARASTSTCSTSSLARPRRAADRQGRRDRRQDHHRARQREAEAGVPAQDPPQRDPVRGRLQRARRRLRRGGHGTQGRRATATAGGSTARRSSPPPRTSPIGTGSAPAPIPSPKHRGITLFLLRIDQPGITITASDHRRRAHQLGLLRRRLCGDDYLRRRAQQGFPVHLRGARPRALHDVHLLPHRAAHGRAVRPSSRPSRATASRCATTRSSAAHRAARQRRPRWLACSASASSPSR